MADLYDPLQALEQGHWFKLICGASFQHLPAVRNLTLAYTLAGADCIDVAADPAVIFAAQSALQVAKDFTQEAQQRGFIPNKTSPLLMVSLNDGEDPHFRKAEFDPTQCPTNCNRPCEKICPAQAIVFNNNQLSDFSGVVSQKCYGCGRCLPACPYEIIYTSSYVSTPGAIAPLILSSGVDAVEIHTQVGRLAGFQRLWNAILPWVGRLKLVAISCPDGDGVIEYMKSLYTAIAPLPCALIWQTDGRPMSGDIGKGTTLATVKFGQKVLTAKLPGYVQLAGGTNSYTVAKLKAMGLWKNLGSQSPKSPISKSQPKIAGVAYGSYARKLLSSVLEQLEAKEVSHTNEPVNIRLETEPELLWQAVSLAHSLVSQLKSQQYP
ncbi:MAG: LdpA C-terminal domain-containing domain [Calothrix sp. MO_192.B10]|nr:LdpA C-terminal domain-containing domain [Calothrix sp. MO_192.B10]